MLASEDVTAEKILETVKGIKSPEIEHTEIFDVYKGVGIPEGFKSIAARIRYRSYDRTLTDEEIGVIHSKIIDNLINKVKVSIR